MCNARRPRFKPACCFSAFACRVQCQGGSNSISIENRRPRHEKCDAEQEPVWFVCSTLDSMIELSDEMMKRMALRPTKASRRPRHEKCDAEQEPVWSACSTLSSIFALSGA